VTPSVGELLNEALGPQTDDWNPPVDKSVPQSVKAALGLLTAKDRRKLLLASVVQTSLGLLDLLGVALLGLVGAIAVSGLDPSSLPAWVSDWLAKVGLENATASQLAGIVAATAASILVLKTAISAYLTRRIFFFLANRQADVSARMARDLLSRQLLDVQRWSTAQVIYALTGGVNAATVSLLGASLIIVSEVFLFGIMAVGLFIIDPLTTIAAGIYFAVIVYLLGVILGRASARNSHLMAETGMTTMTAVSEALITYRETTVLNRRELYVSSFEKLVRTSARASASNMYMAEIPKYVLETALVVGGFALAVVQFLTRDLSAAAATVALFLAAGFRIIPSLLRLQGASIGIRSAAAAARKTLEIWDYLQTNPAPVTSDIPVEQHPAEIKAAISRGHGDFQASVVLEDASVTYRNADSPALAHVSLVVHPGESLALVGSTGAGKSTLADVLLGVVDADEGVVRISGLSPRDAILTWPGAIAYVPQDVALVQGTVRDNVALGLPTAAIDDDLVWEALERARLAQFLREDREGIDTVIGERGVRLSGGQRQRLGIARALYTRPRLLLLDEATSALDAETEQLITQTLQELEGDVTTITVAHRLATIRHADQVIYLKDGLVAARGTFEEVRAAAPDFARQARILGL
jgi:ABC-type multidrug transport system fused ATPase/permease subunit